jgi:putative endopeptidase
MFKRVSILILISTVWLSSCVSSSGVNNSLPVGKPEFGRFGIDTAGMDTGVKPGNDFYLFANGKWAAKTPIPADRSNFGLFNQLNDRSDQRTKAIIEQIAAQTHAPGSESAKVADLYRSFMDEAAIEANGIRPLQDIFKQIDQVSTRDQLVALVGRMARSNVGAPLTAYISVDRKDPTTHVGYVSQGGLGLPDKDMYVASNTSYAKQRDGYLKMITALFELAQLQEPANRARAVYALEEKMAAAHWSRVDSRNADKTYNLVTREQLTALGPKINWNLFLHELGLANEPRVIVGQPSAIEQAASLLATEPIAVWQDYARLRWLTSTAPFLPKAFVDTHFAFNGPIISGTPQQQPRWKRAVDRVTSTLGEVVGKEYVKAHFSQNTKDKARAMVNNILAAMGSRIDALDWMSEQTKVRAREKLATYNTKIGYPDKWRDYTALQIRADDLLGNVQRATEFNYARNLARLGKPADKNDWYMTPMTVNAYYSAQGNEIVFPAAILQPPFFDANADDAVNYGAIGGVIGHEISHGFDDNGSRFDAKGRLNNWWTDTDRAKFNAAAGKLIEQYNRYCPFEAANGQPAQCVKGALTIGENIADLAGLTIAYQAYKKSLGGKPAPVIDGMTGDQRFFLGWAQSWRRNMRDAERQNRLLTGVHSPEPYRAAIVRNVDAWYEAFDVKPGDALYLAPQERVRIW